MYLFSFYVLYVIQFALNRKSRQWIHSAAYYGFKDIQNTLRIVCINKH